MKMYDKRLVNIEAIGKRIKERRIAWGHYPDRLSVRSQCFATDTFGNRAWTDAERII